MFLERKARNAAYSTRAFARDLGISQALLSLVLSGKRPLTVKQAAQMSVLLGFDKDQAQAFLETTLLALPENSKALKRLRRERRAAGATALPAKPHFIDYELERFKALSHWYHLAILDLTTTQGFVDDPVWIARRLGIGPVEARDARERLLTLGLLGIDPATGGVFKRDTQIFFATRKSEGAVRAFHQQMIGKALDQLKRTDQASFDARQISAMTMAIPKSAWPEAKARIQKFQQELAALVTQGDCDEVYQLNVQMFPLTQAVSKTPESPRSPYDRAEQVL